jgi:polygalacturonase
MGALDIKTQNAVMRGTPSDLRVSMRGNAGAEIGMNTTHPKIFIDQSDCFEAVGVGPTFRQMDKYTAKSDQKATEQIGRIVREGRMMMSVERGGGGDTALPRIARDRGSKPYANLVVREIPQPKTTAQMGEVKIYDRSRRLQTSTYETPDTQKYIPGGVTITWGTKPSIDIFIAPGTEYPNPKQGLINLLT